MLDRFKSIHKWYPTLSFEGYNPSLLGKHVNTCQKTFDSSVVTPQPGNVYQVCLPLLIRTTHNSLSSGKPVTNLFLESIGILTFQPLFNLFSLHFNFLCQCLNSSKAADTFDVIISRSQLALSFPHDGMEWMMGEGQFMREIPTLSPSLDLLVLDW